MHKERPELSSVNKCRHLGKTREFVERASNGMVCVQLT